MDNQRILERAIQKALDNGWLPESLNRPEIKQLFLSGPVRDYVFDHDFAKALWGEEVWTAFSDFEGNEEVELYVWQYHLQQMVIVEDSIKYLGDNLGE